MRSHARAAYEVDFEFSCEVAQTNPGCARGPRELTRNLDTDTYMRLAIPTSVYAASQSTFGPAIEFGVRSGECASPAHDLA